MSFQDEDQCRAACDLLLARFDLPPWFTQDRIDLVLEELDAHRSNSRAAMIGFCMAMFNGHNRCRVSDLVALDAGNLEAVATLLIARNRGPYAVAAWMVTDGIKPCPEPGLPPGFVYVDGDRTRARRKVTR